MNTPDSHIEFNVDVSILPEQLQLNFEVDCFRIADLDNDTVVTGSDTSRLSQCIAHNQLQSQGMTTADANTILGMDFSTYCQITMSQW